MKVLLFCARGFETMEFSVFIDVMGWARNDYDYNIEVDTCGFSKQVISTFNVTIIVDKIIEEIDTAEYDALAIPGGFEEYNFYEEAFDERLLKLIREFDNAKKPIATICVAALALGKSGILKGRKATTYHLKAGYRQKQLAEFGVDVIPNQSIVVDDNVITSYCPETAAHVAFTLLEKLTDLDRMKIVKQAMGY